MSTMAAKNVYQVFHKLQKIMHDIMQPSKFQKIVTEGGKHFVGKRQFL